MINASIINTLYEVGLSKIEAQIYLEILGKKNSIISELSKTSLLNRDKTRYICNKLVEKGFLYVRKEKKTFYYSANPPEKIISTLELEKIIISKKQEGVLRIIDELKKLMNPDIFLPIKFQHGIDGVIQTYKDTLNEGKEILAYENIEKLSPDLTDYLANNYVPRRVKKGIFARVIAPSNHEHKLDSKLDYMHNRETRFLPKHFDSIELEINIYGQKVAIFSYQPQEMFSVIIESPAFSNTLKTIFNFCWINSLKHI